LQQAVNGGSLFNHSTGETQMKFTHNELVTLHTLVGIRIGNIDLSGACNEGAPAQQSNIRYRNELDTLRHKLEKEIDYNNSQREQV
jgi:hypothetical protein